MSATLFTSMLVTLSNSMSANFFCQPPCWHVGHHACRPPCWPPLCQPPCAKCYGRTDRFTNWPGKLLETFACPKKKKLIPHFAGGCYLHIYIAIKANPTVVSGRNTYAGSTFVLWLTRVQYGGRRTLGVPLMIIIYRIQNPNANQPMSNNVSFCHFDPAFLSNLYVSGQHGVETLFSRAEYWTSLCWLFSRFVVKCPSSSVKLHHTTISTTAYGCDTISSWKGKPKKEFLFNCNWFSTFI